MQIHPTDLPQQCIPPLPPCVEPVDYWTDSVINELLYNDIRHSSSDSTGHLFSWAEENDSISVISGSNGSLCRSLSPDFETESHSFSHSFLLNVSESCESHSLSDNSFSSLDHLRHDDEPFIHFFNSTPICFAENTETASTHSSHSSTQNQGRALVPSSNLAQSGVQNRVEIETMDNPLTNVAPLIPLQQKSVPQDCFPRQRCIESRARTPPSQRNSGMNVTPNPIGRRSRRSSFVTSGAITPTFRVITVPNETLNLELRITQNANARGRHDYMKTSIEIFDTSKCRDGSGNLRCLYMSTHQHGCLWLRQLPVQRSLLVATVLTSCSSPEKLPIDPLLIRLFNQKININHIHAFMGRVASNIVCEGLATDIRGFWWRPLRYGGVILQSKKTGRLTVFSNPDCTLRSATATVSAALTFLANPSELNIPDFKYEDAISGEVPCAPLMVELFNSKFQTVEVNLLED